MDQTLKDTAPLDQGGIKIHCQEIVNPIQLYVCYQKNKYFHWWTILNNDRLVSSFINSVIKPFIKWMPITPLVYITIKTAK